MLLVDEITVDTAKGRAKETIMQDESSRAGGQQERQWPMYLAAAETCLHIGDWHGAKILLYRAYAVASSAAEVLEKILQFFFQLGLHANVVCVLHEIIPEIARDRCQLSLFEAGLRKLFLTKLRLAPFSESENFWVADDFLLNHHSFMRTVEEKGFEDFSEAPLQILRAPLLELRKHVDCREEVRRSIDLFLQILQVGEWLKQYRLIEAVEAMFILEHTEGWEEVAGLLHERISQVANDFWPEVEIAYSMSRAASEPSDRIARLIEELRLETKQATAEQENLPPMISFWNAIQQKIIDKIHSRDPRTFLLWSEIIATMMPLANDPILHMKNELIRLPDWQHRWEPVLHFERELPFMPFERPDLPPLMIQHAYLLHHFEEMSARRIEELEMVFEFGGGIGNFCLLSKRLGFSGSYVLYDLPVISALQRFFLAIHGFSARRLAKKDNLSAGIYTTDDVAAAAEIPVPRKNSLFLGFWSYSESPHVLRERFIDFLRRFELVYLAFCEHGLNGEDDRTYFRRFTERIPEYHWNLTEMTHRPGHYLLFGSAGRSSGDRASARN